MDEGGWWERDRQWGMQLDCVTLPRIFIHSLVNVLMDSVNDSAFLSGHALIPPTIAMCVLLVSGGLIDFLGWGAIQG